MHCLRILRRHLSLRYLGTETFLRIVSQVNPSPSLRVYKKRKVGEDDLINLLVFRKKAGKYSSVVDHVVIVHVMFLKIFSFKE